MNNTNQSSSTQALFQLHHALAIRADPFLAQTITSVVNEGYRHLPADAALRWDADAFGGDRLPTPQAIHEAIGHDGLFAVAHDTRDSTTPLACAAAKRWKHDLEGHCAPGEKGWEIITVTNRVGFKKRGLAGQCVDALVKNLVRQAREDGSDEVVQVWAQAVEETC